MATLVGKIPLSTKTVSVVVDSATSMVGSVAKSRLNKTAIDIGDVITSGISSVLTSGMMSLAGDEIVEGVTSKIGKLAREFYIQNFYPNVLSIISEKAIDRLIADAKQSVLSNNDFYSELYGLGGFSVVRGS